MLSTRETEELEAISRHLARGSGPEMTSSPRSPIGQKGKCGGARDWRLLHVPCWHVGRTVCSAEETRRKVQPEHTLLMWAV